MQNFIKYLQSKDFTQNTQKSYCRHVNDFLKWYDKDAINCNKKDIIKYLEHIKATRKQSNRTRSLIVVALNHYFTFLITGHTLTQNPCTLIKIRGVNKKVRCNIFSSDELEQLCDDFYHYFIAAYDEQQIKKMCHNRLHILLSRQRNYAMLTILAYQGLQIHELPLIKISDVNINKGTIKITATNVGAERTLPLKAAQIGSLINYLQNVRPQFLALGGDSDKLFLLLPDNKKNTARDNNLIAAHKKLSAQIRTINKSFINFRQIRASVIAHWLRNEGLRKTQWLAGHRHIHATERFVQNNMEELTSDIAKFNPFGS